MSVAAGDRVAILGMDAVSAEVLVNLLTGSTLPDAGGVTVFGRSTSEIADSADWLAVVDRFGIVSERSVLLEGLQVVQNLAIPFTLDIEPVSADVRSRAEQLAREVGLDAARWDAAVATLDVVDRMRIRLGRALALDPRVLLLEHVSAGFSPGDAVRLGADIGALAERRGVAIVAATSDEAFARAVARRVLRWEPATGRLAERRGWFGRRLG